MGYRGAAFHFPLTHSSASAIGSSPISQPMRIHKTSAQQPQAEKHENIMAKPNSEARAEPTHKDQLVERLQALFAELSGLGTADLNPRTSFLELGLDSLLLTQASAAIQKSFRVKIPFRDLLEDLSTLDALAGRLDAELPHEPKMVAEVPSPAKVATNPAIAGPGAERVVAGSSLERIFARQLELMSRQLEMLRDEGAQETRPWPRACVARTYLRYGSPRRPSSRPPSGRQ